MFKPINAAANNQGRFLLFGFLVALALLVMISDQLGLLRPVEQVSATVLSPVESATYRLGQNLSDASAFFSDLKKLQQENADLRQQLDKARANEAKVADLANQLELQKRQQQFLSNPDYKSFSKVASDVINHDTTGQNQTIVINHGDSDGIKRGQPVVDAAGYLVGRVEKVVEAHQSIVMLMTDSSLAVRISTQRYDKDNKKVNVAPADGDAIVQWQTGGRIKVMHFLPDADVQTGDWVFTSSVSTTFPANILIGKLDKVFKEPGQSEQQADLIPIADLNHLPQVWVITGW